MVVIVVVVVVLLLPRKWNERLEEDWKSRKSIEQRKLVWIYGCVSVV